MFNFTLLRNCVWKCNIFNVWYSFKNLNGNILLQFQRVTGCDWKCDTFYVILLTKESWIVNSFRKLNNGKLSTIFFVYKQSVMKTMRKYFSNILLHFYRSPLQQCCWEAPRGRQSEISYYWPETKIVKYKSCQYSYIYRRSLSHYACIYIEKKYVWLPPFVRFLWVISRITFLRNKNICDW